MEISPHLWRRVEIWLAAAVLAASLVFAGLTAHAMATTSLSTDEFGTIGTFSSRGPWRVLTDYRAPKNHIFFNLLNSVLPARDSLEPARARALSIVATLLTGALIAAYAARRGRWMEGAALVAVWALAPETLPLSMEARGYGFLGLFAVVISIAAIEHLRDGRRTWLFTLAVGTVLGVYTVPSFLFFAGPLLLLLWLTKRDLPTFFTGLATGLVILALYAPVLGQLAAAFGSYQTTYEAEFAHLSSLWKAARLFVTPGPDAKIATLLLALLIAPIALFRWQASDRRGLVILALAGAIYFATLLFLKTPPLRVAAFGFLPLLFAGLFAAGAVIRRVLPAPVRTALFAGLTLAFLFALVRGIRTFDFLPTENWTLAGRAIDAAFPKTVPVDFHRFAKYLRHTLPDARARSADFSETAFASGQLVVADAGNKWVDPVRFVAPAGVPEVLQWTIPGRIRDVVLTFRRPANDAVDGLSPELSDGNPRTTVPISPEGTAIAFSTANAQALVLLLNHPVTDRQLKISTDVPGAFLAGNAIVVPLRAAKENWARKIFLRPSENGLAMTEAWLAR